MQETVLMAAIANHSEEVVRLLLDHVTDINATDALGRTSLDYAAKHSPKLVDLLKEAGAKRSAYNIDDWRWSLDKS